MFQSSIEEDILIRDVLNLNVNRYFKTLHYSLCHSKSWDLWGRPCHTKFDGLLVVDFVHGDRFFDMLRLSWLVFILSITHKSVFASLIAPLIPPVRLLLIGCNRSLPVHFKPAWVTSVNDGHVTKTFTFYCLLIFSPSILALCKQAVFTTSKSLSTYLVWVFLTHCPLCFSGPHTCFKSLLKPNERKTFFLNNIFQASQLTYGQIILHVVKKTEMT